MTGIRVIVGDERSAVRLRHAAIASALAVAGVSAAIFLISIGSQLYEQTSHRVLWALVESAGALAS